MEDKTKKIVICPDSFKGTMSSMEVAEIIAAAISAEKPNTSLVLLPIADGGEGTLDCFRKGIRGRLSTVQVRSSNFKLLNSDYLLTSNGAIIESAKVIGITITEDMNPARTTTYGVGQLIADALRHTKKIILALGGSSTNDGGCGIASALGAKFFNKSGIDFVPTGGTLCEIERIDISALPKLDMTCMCDVTNPIYGENGAAYVFAPQKGASPQMVKELDDGLRHLAQKIKESTGTDVSEIVGGGAAGATAAGMVAFFNAKLKSGIGVMLDTVGFDDIISDANLIITGEGRLDSQSFQGKAIDGILDRAMDKNIPVIAICGQVDKKINIKQSGLMLARATEENADLMLPERDYKTELYFTVRKLFSTL